MANQVQDIKLANYAVAFIDLLGQKAAMAGEGLLPVFSTVDQYETFLARVRQSVGSVYTLYEHAENMLREMHVRADSPLRESLGQEQRVLWDQVHAPVVQCQRWSDGLMAFGSIAAPDSVCPTIGTFDLIALSGALCLLGLASKRPVRGGIDLAWGVQLRPGELNGPAVACAYQIESEVAGYPRIAVGSNLNDYLHYCSAANGSTANNLISIFASRSLQMLTTDTDGVVIVDYLGAEFRQNVSQSQHPALYEAGFAYLRDQLQAHCASGDRKLEERYRLLEVYFEARPTC